MKIRQMSNRKFYYFVIESDILYYRYKLVASFFSSDINDSKERIAAKNDLQYLILKNWLFYNLQDSMIKKKANKFSYSFPCT